jgi:hypothetical protein
MRYIIKTLPLYFRLLYDFSGAEMCPNCLSTESYIILVEEVIELFWCHRNLKSANSEARESPQPQYRNNLNIPIPVNWELFSPV